MYRICPQFLEAFELLSLAVFLVHFFLNQTLLSPSSLGQGQKWYNKCTASSAFIHKQRGLNVVVLCSIYYCKILIWSIQSFH